MKNYGILKKKRCVGQLPFHSIDIDAELRTIKEKEADLIGTRQILKQADKQKEVPLTNTNRRDSAQ